jgi:hypothetical protein
MVGDATTLDPGEAVVEFGATVNAALVVIGDRLALDRTLAGARALAPAEPGERTGTADTYVEYDADSGRCALSPAQAAVLVS